MARALAVAENDSRQGNRFRTGLISHLKDSVKHLGRGGSALLVFIEKEAAEKVRERQGLSIIIPTRNGGPLFGELLERLEGQTRRAGELLVIDSSSEDGSADLARRHGARVEVISPAVFDHGGTRNLATRLAVGDLLLFMTQDAVPADDLAVERLLDAFSLDPRIRVAYGRQLPRADASPFAAFLRRFNYPAVSEIRGFEDRHGLGFRTAFASNSFCLYDRSALEAVGGFPENLLFGEDACTVAAILEQGWRVAYTAEARVVHSHNYSLIGEFRRYFDVGAFHAHKQRLLEVFGAPGGEGRRYVGAELAYLWRHGHAVLLPLSLLRNGVKWLGYRLGRQAFRLPPGLAARLGMNPGWWQKRRTRGRSA